MRKSIWILLVVMMFCNVAGITSFATEKVKVETEQQGGFIEKEEVEAEKPEESSKEETKVEAEKPEESSKEETKVEAEKPEETSKEETKVEAEKPEESSKEEMVEGLAKKNKKLLLYADGEQVKKKGWYSFSGKEFYINAKGYVIGRLAPHKKTWRYSKYKAGKWNIQKETWLVIGNEEYYFNAKGYAKKIYNKRTNKVQIYRDGAWKNIKEELAALKNGKMYYFNSKGKKVKQTGWKKIQENTYIRLGTKGVVLSKLEKPGNVWRYYEYNGKWQKQKNVWKLINDKNYYFDAKGNGTKVYDTISKTYYDYKKGTEVLVKNEVRPIGKKEFYFGKEGVLVSAAGLYFTAAEQLVQVLSDGSVGQIITGNVQEYTQWDGKITSCRVLDENYMCYYNGDGELLRKIDVNGTMVALTYDDGPSIYTMSILETLKQYDSVATFFVVGNRVSEYASALKRTKEIGCEIGNHTYSHPILTTLGAAGIQEQIAKTNTLVQEITGVSPVVMRPPGGGNNATVKSVVGMPIILWSIDTLDWKIRNAASVQAAVLNHVKDGDIILMHDLHATTAQASKVIIPELVRRGYQLVTVSELADCRGGMANGSVYHKFNVSVQP